MSLSSASPIHCMLLCCYIELQSTSLKWNKNIQSRRWKSQLIALFRVSCFDVRSFASLNATMKTLQSCQQWRFPLLPRILVVEYLFHLDSNSNHKLNFCSVSNCFSRHRQGKRQEIFQVHSQFHLRVYSCLLECWFITTYLSTRQNHEGIVNSMSSLRVDKTCQRPWKYLKYF